MGMIFLRGEKEDQEGDVKTGQYVLLTDLTNGEMWTLGESIGGRGIQFEGKDEFHFGFVGSEKSGTLWLIYLDENFGLEILTLGVSCLSDDSYRDEVIFKMKSWVWNLN